MAGDPEKLQEPLVELRQLAFAQLLRNLDEAEQCEQDDQHGHEHGGLLSGQPSRAGTGGVTDELHRLAQVPAVPGPSRGTTDLKVSHRS